MTEATTLTEADHILTEDAASEPVHAICMTCYPVPVPEQVGACGRKPATAALDMTPDPFRPWCEVCMETKVCPVCGVVFR